VKELPRADFVQLCAEAQSAQRTLSVWRHKRDEAIRRWHSAGGSMREIAFALGMSPGTVNNIIQAGRR
jgi:IS30 family transposase